MRIVLGVLFASLTLVNSFASAQEQKIDVEFNELQQANSGCRAVFVLHNGLAATLDALTLRVVAFDTEGHADIFLSLDVGTMPTNKTRVLRFDLGNKVECKSIGRLVLDDVTSCKGTGVDPAACLNSVALSSRAGVPFDF